MDDKFYLVPDSTGKCEIYRFKPGLPHIEVSELPPMLQTRQGTPQVLYCSVEADFAWWEYMKESSGADTSPKTPTDAKLAEVGAACQATIYAGIEVGGNLYSLTEHDQIELMAQQSAVMAGAQAVPYHADGELCRMYDAQEFMSVASAATAHIFYHRTYCNHLNVWIRRAAPAELETITYGAQLPDDLLEHMRGILEAAAGGMA